MRAMREAREEAKEREAAVASAPKVARLEDVDVDDTDVLSQFLNMSPVKVGGLD